MQENEAIRFDKLKQLYKKELDWVRRQPKARTTKSKSRVDVFNSIETAIKSSKEQQPVSYTHLDVYKRQDYSIWIRIRAKIKRFKFFMNVLSKAGTDAKNGICIFYFKN